MLKKDLDLKIEQDNFLMIFNAAPVGILVLNENERITKVNEAGLDMLKSSKEQSIGKRFGDSFYCIESFKNEKGCSHSVQCKKCEIKIAVALALQSGSSTTNIEFNKFYVINKKVVEFWFKAGITPMIDNGSKNAVIVLMDITDSKNKEKAIIEAKLVAETATKAKSEFLANMSHEIRTPLNGIVGMVDLTLLSGLNTEQKENLTIVKSCVTQLLHVINDILDFSKMEAGKLVVDNINFDIKVLFEETIKAHTPHAVEKGVQIRYDFPPSFSQYLIGDPKRLLQILNNLLTNAIKFTDEGEVWVKAKTINTSGDFIEIQFLVEDTGIGISKENIDKLFKSFSQVDGSFTKKVGGTGLGLAISKQLCEIMGGRLWVESKIGLGSTFYFTLGFGLGTKIDMKPLQITKVDKIKKSCNILLTEDDKVNQMVLTKLLEERGYSVDTANNGVEAIEMFEKKSYDVILMDIQMPLMDGVEATKRIRKMENGKNIPIIAITAYALNGDREKFLSHGMDEYIAKPTKVNKLYSTIDKCLTLNKNRNLSEIGICFDDNGEVVLKQKEIRDFDHIKQSHLAELSDLVETLNDAIIYNKIASIEVISHKIKNLSNEIGIEELKTVAFKIELSARRGNFNEVIDKIQIMNSIFDVFKKLEVR